RARRSPLFAPIPSQNRTKPALFAGLSPAATPSRSQSPRAFNREQRIDPRWRDEGGFSRPGRLCALHRPRKPCRQARVRSAAGHRAAAAVHPGHDAGVAGLALESPGPVLFCQKRTGQHGRTFPIFKFRSMRVMEKGGEVRQAVEGDDRITRVGRIIRKLSLDELPQLFNVIAGQMSLVGPRPHAILHDEFYGTRIAGYALRQQVKPGITGWAQVNGSRGPTPSIETMRRRIALDAWYVANHSLALDIKILIR